MRVARGVHLRVRGHIPFERRQLGIVGGVVSGLLNPILGGPSTTTPGQPAQTTTPAVAGPGTTTTPPPAGNTANPVNGGGDPIASPSSGTGSGNRGDVAAKGAGTSTIGSPTGTASNPSGSSVSPGGNKGGTSSSTSSGGTTSGTGGDADGDSSKGSGSEPNSGTRGGSNPSKGSSYSTSGSGSGSGTSDGDPSSPAPSDVKTISDSKGNNSHAGAIAAAVILTLLLGVAVVIFILRRRSKARRNDQANKWWFTRKRTSQTYGDDEVLHTGNSSRRSSFATTVDHSKAPFLAKAAIPPPPPPMAEVGRSKGTAPSLVLDINPDQSRFSIGSAGSHDSQFLVIHHRESLLHHGALDSARTESFPFPKPPAADRASLHSKASWHSLSDLKQDGDVFAIASPPNPSQPTLPQLPVDPFADNNPFADPSCAPSSDLEQDVIGTVYRPFFPQLQDELQVDIGDSVRILQSFDDGWALAEKMDLSNGGQGFVPLECFLELGQSSPGKTCRSSRGRESV